MATAYTPILQLALPVTGELQGTWGTVVNDNITSMIEQAIAGLATINTWTTASHTLTTANGTTSEARCAVLECSGAPGAAATVICPASTKLYVIKNSVTGGYAVTLKTSAGTGISVPNGATALLYCDGTNVVSGATYMATVSTTQVDILAQGDLRLQDTTGGEYVALQAPATLAASYTLTMPVDDGTAGQALITDGSGVLSWSTAASGDVYGPASATDNAVARFDGTTGKIIQNSAVTIADDGATVIDVNSTSAGLRITQVGTGNALTVEDSTNPDATPTVITASGNMSIGGSTQTNYGLSVFASSFTNSGIWLESNDFNAEMNVTRASTNSGAPFYLLNKARGTVDAYTTVISSDLLGVLYFRGYDGANFIQGASITAAVDGTPGTNDMPGRLTFSTTADGASTPTERMRIDNAGRVGIGGTPTASYSVFNAKAMTGATTEIGYGLVSTIQSDVTTLASGYRSNLTTQATAFTLANLYHYEAAQTAFGAGSTVTNQYGFVVGTTLTGATNNYGFYSNIASGTGRWNFYANGTAENFFGGNTVVSVTDNTNAALRITQLGTGNALLVEDSSNPDASPFVIDAAGSVFVGATASPPAIETLVAKMALSSATDAAVSEDIGLYNYRAAGGSGRTRVSPKLFFARSRSGVNNTIGGVVTSGELLGSLRFAGDDGTAFITAAEINSEVDGTPGTNDMPGRLVFSTTADGASSPTERMRIDSAGRVGVGTTSLTGYRVRVGGVFETTGTTGLAIAAETTIPSNVTGNAYGFYSAINTAASAFTLGNLHHYRAAGQTPGAGSTVTNQYGFHADNGLTGATNNYGFYSNIASGTGRYNFYAAGTAENFFGGVTTVSASNSVPVIFGNSGNTSAFLVLRNSTSTANNVRIGAESNDFTAYTSALERLRIASTGTISLGAAVGSESLRVTPVASSVNYLNVQGAITTASPSITAEGSDTNIDLALTPKGTGVLKYGTYTAGIIAQAGYISIKDAGGTTRRLLVG